MITKKLQLNPEGESEKLSTLMPTVQECAQEVCLHGKPRPERVGAKAQILTNLLGFAGDYIAYVDSKLHYAGAPIYVESSYLTACALLNLDPNDTNTPRLVKEWERNVSPVLKKVTDIDFFPFAGVKEHLTAYQTLDKELFERYANLQGRLQPAVA